MREADLISYYVDQLVALLSTPLGLAALAGLLALVAATAAVPGMRWVCVVGLIYVTTLPLTEGASIRYAALAPPLEQLRNAGRPLTYLFLVLMLLPLMASQRGWRNRLIAAPLLVFFVFELLIAVRLIGFGSGVRGALSVFSHCLILLTVGLALSRWLQSMEDVYKLLWCLSLAGGLVVVATSYQLAINRTLVITNSRLIGVTGNPQFMGIIMAYTLPITCHLLTRSSGRVWIKPLLIVQVTLMIVMLIWTGSRTGAITALAGLSILFHRRLGRFFLLGVVMAVAVFFVLPFFEGSSEIASRLVWTTNTRQQSWGMMTGNFLRSPIFGVSGATFDTAENSYLAMLSQFGLVGSLPCFLAMGLLVQQLKQLYGVRSRLGPERSLIDLVLALWCAVFVTSVLEGLLMGVITYPVMMIYALSSLTTCLMDWAQTDETYAFEGIPEYAAAA